MVNPINNLIAYQGFDEYDPMEEIGGWYPSWF
jgi:hypothetical protein